VTPEDMRQLYEYNAWANHRLLDACAVLSPEQFTRDLKSSFPSVRDTLAHILGAEWLWHQRFLGNAPTSLPSPSDFPAMDVLREKWAEVERDFLGFVAGLAQKDLDRVHQFRTMAGEPYPTPLWQAMQHVVNHGSYHRGQVTAFLRQLGAKGVSLDMIRFYRDRAAGASA